jgi:hypothetical protein
MSYDGIYATDDKNASVSPQSNSQNIGPSSIEEANLTKKQGLVNAVVCAIRCGHRGILADLLRNWSGYAVLTGDLRVTDVTPEPGENLEADTIHYSLLFLSAIARSVHRDLYLA